MNYGTLNIVKVYDDEYFEIKADYDVEMMIQRLVPTHMSHPLRVRVHPDNTRMIRMITKEFPLDIQTNQWETVQEVIKQREILKEKVEKLNYVEPDKAYFNGELLPFQKQGLDFIQKTDGITLITDEMGLGKTIEALAFISKNPNKMPVVVVAPLVTLINWKREILKFLTLANKRPDNQETFYDDKGREPMIQIIRSGKRQQLQSADFYLINYELVDKRLSDICNINPQMVILDEIQSVRNYTTKKYGACRTLALQPSVLHRLGLSGTPIYNRGTEMYNICEIIKPGLLGDKREFINKYCMAEWYTDKTSEQGKIGLSKLLRESIMIRRKKMDVLTDLPDKIRMKQEIQIDEELYEEELQKLYDKIDDARAELATKDTDEDKKYGLFALNQKIREMRVAERQIAGLAKAPHIVDYLNNLLEDYEEEKFVVFCHHRSVHQILYDGLYRYHPEQIIGGQSDKQRQMAIDNFQKNDSRVIICGLRAGNVGINLTSSAYVIFAELDWSPSIHRQAEDRLHRIGQKSQVFAHYLEGSGTFDEVLSQILLKKTVTINDALGDKMESLNNQKAIEFLEDKFKSRKPSLITEQISETKSYD